MLRHIDCRRTRIANITPPNSSTHGFHCHARNTESLLSWSGVLIPLIHALRERGCLPRMEKRPPYPQKNWRVSSPLTGISGCRAENACLLGLGGVLSQETGTRRHPHWLTQVSFQTRSTTSCSTWNPGFDVRACRDVSGRPARRDRRERYVRGR